uniref:Uncharacterized protein n=1 Tax=Strigamia maritima TaxID=126957 RepID=T1J369_STRMM
MGSCYSCKSGQQEHTYNTVDMANTNSDNKFVDPLKNRVCPYTRGSTTSFGFNKKRVPTTLKSLNQDHTNEMVTNYESKIANMNANNMTDASRTSPRHNKYSHIPRFGFKTANSTNSLGSSEELDSSTSSLNNAEPNTNNNIIEKCASKAPVNGLKPRLTDPTAKNNNQTSKRRSQETISETRRPHTAKVYNQPKEPVANRPKSSGSRIATYTSGIKQPTKVNARVTGLPKLQTLRIANKETEENKKKPHKFNFEKAPLARFDDVEAMHVSSDTLPDEEVFDSGLGNSESDKKEGDNETLAEVSELATDCNTGSLARGKMELRTPKPTSISLNAVGKSERKAVDLMKKITSRFNQEDDFGNVKEEKTTTNEEMRIVKNETGDTRLECGDRKRPMIQSSPDSIRSPVEMDSLSPPSERDTFLIDDEICDQPQLIQCQSPDYNSKDIFANDQDLFAEG